MAVLQGQPFHFSVIYSWILTFLFVFEHSELAVGIAEPEFFHFHGLDIEFVDEVVT